jgi:hypothetical protein
MRLCFILSAALAFGLAQAVSADVLTGKAAKKALYSGDEVAVQVMKQAFFVDNQAEILATAAAQQPYYGAIAVSPKEGLMSEATIAAVNYHSVEAASVVALTGCDAARKGEVPCVIVALIRPEGWEARPVQMSSEATAAFRKDYGGKGAALAVSMTTGSWSMAKGTNAADEALSACASKLTGANDCKVIIAD